MKHLYHILITFAVVCAASSLFAQGGQWNSYTTTNSLLTNDSIIGITFDANGAVWLESTPLGGIDAICQLTGSTWKVHHEINIDEISNIVNPLLYANGVLWAGNAWTPQNIVNGLSKFDGTSWTTYTIDNSGLVDDPIVCLASDNKNNLWIGTQRGLNKLAPDNTWTTYTPDNVPQMPYWGIRDVTTDASANVWMDLIGTHGLLEFPGGKAANARYFDQDTIPNFPSDYMGPLAVDWNGNVWAGTEQSGIVKLDGNGATVYNTITTPVLKNDNVHSIAVDQCGHVWAGTDLGNARYDGSWTTYSFDDGHLAGNVVYKIAVDGPGHIWFGTNGGVTEFKPLPEKPTLSSPANWATITTDSTTCRWAWDCPGILKYWHEIADNPSFTNSHVDTTSASLMQSASKWDTIFVNHATYYWRIKAENDAGWGPFSDTWNFTVNQASGVSMMSRMHMGCTLDQNFPNPCSEGTNIHFSLAQREHISLKLYDMLGRECGTLLDEEMGPGGFDVPVDMKILTQNGVYAYRLLTGDDCEQRMMQFMR